MRSDDNTERRILLCLNSGQVVQNLISALNVVSCEVALFTTTETGRQLDNLMHALKIDEIDLFCEPCEVPPYDFERLEKAFLEWAADHEKELGSAQIVLNATGGTKPMSFMAQRVFGELFPGMETVYVESADEQRMVKYSPKPVTITPLNVPMSLAACFACYGFEAEVKPAPSYEDRKFDRLFKYIEKEFDVCAEAFSTFLRDRIPPGYRRTEKLEKLMDILIEAGIVDGWDPSTLICRWDEDNPHYMDLFHHELCGWLEVYIYRLLREMGYENVFRGVCLKPLGKSEKELIEFDVVLLDGVKLTIFECKTGYDRMGGWKKIIHYLQSTSKMSAGAFTSPVLVMSSKYGTPREMDKIRADITNVEIMDRGDFQDKKETMKRIRKIIESKSRIY